MATCFLIDSAAAGAAAARLARVRGARLIHCSGLDALPEQIPQGSMIAIGAARMREFPRHRKGHLLSLVGQGATLYVRGVAGGARTLDLRPFAPIELAIASERRAVAYRFTASRMLPAVLAGEATAGVLLDVPGAERRFDSAIEELLVVRHVDGVERAAIFALRYGDGCVIHDLSPELNPEHESGVEPLVVAQLGRRETRHQYAGALAAANHAAGIDPARLPPFNLVIDDRPANYDHFSATPVTTLLRHIENLCPGAHTDFAWTPRHSSPSRAYLEAAKKFSTGFVWHGLFRHVDHRAIEAPATELARGRRMVGQIERRFGIRLQPIMVYPFERSAPGQYPLLARAGFLANVEQPQVAACTDSHWPPSPNDSAPSHTDPTSGLTILYRYPAASLGRDRMLAMATLGLPIIASAHPDEVGLKRFSRFWDRGGDASHFDEILKFASAKGLPPQSLEDIAIEVRNSRLPDAVRTPSLQAAGGR
ncbi:MAG: hypothetical protein ACXWMT_06835 [Candidatus Binataceae bacterium]